MKKYRCLPYRKNLLNFLEVWVPKKSRCSTSLVGFDSRYETRFSLNTGTLDCERTSHYLSLTLWISVTIKQDLSGLTKINPHWVDVAWEGWQFDLQASAAPSMTSSVAAAGATEISWRHQHSENKGSGARVAEESMFYFWNEVAVCGGPVSGAWPISFSVKWKWSQKKLTKAQKAKGKSASQWSCHNRQRSTPGRVNEMRLLVALMDQWISLTLKSYRASGSARENRSETRCTLVALQAVTSFDAEALHFSWDLWNHLESVCGVVQRPQTQCVCSNVMSVSSNMRWHMNLYPWKPVQSSFKLLYYTSAQRVKLALGHSGQRRGDSPASLDHCHIPASSSAEFLSGQVAWVQDSPNKSMGQSVQSVGTPPKSFLNGKH